MKKITTNGASETSSEDRGNSYIMLMLNVPLPR